MKHFKKLLLIAVIVVACELFTFIFLWNHPIKRVSGETVLSSRKPTDVTQVKVTNAAGAFTISSKDGGYILDDVPSELIDIDKFVAFMTNCAEVKSEKKVSDKDAVSEKFGLKNPAASAEIKFSDNTQLKLNIGNMEPVSKDYYASVEGQNAVYILKSNAVSQFLESKDSLITHLVTPKGAAGPLSVLRNVTFSGGPLTEPVTIEATATDNQDIKRQALSFGAATHIVRGYCTYELDQTYGVTLLGSLLGIEAQKIEGYNLSSEKISSYGFDHPWMTVNFDLKTSDGITSNTLKIVRITDDSYDAMLNDSGIVYRIGKQAFMDIQYSKLQLRWFLMPLIADLKSVKIEAQGETYEFNIDNADKKNPIITSGTDKIDVELFRSLFRLMTSAANDGNYLGPQKNDSDSMLKITYTYADESKTPDVLELKKSSETRRADVFINGKSEYRMKDTFTDRVIEGCKNVMAGIAVEENW